MRRTTWASDGWRVCFVEGYHRWCWAQAVAPWCLVSSTTAWELPGGVVVDKPLTPPAQCLYLSHGESHITDLKGLLLDQVSEPRMHWHNTHSIKLLPLQLALALLRLGQKKLVPGCLPHFPLQPIISFCCCLSFTFIAPPPIRFLTRTTEHTPICRG